MRKILSLIVFTVALIWTWNLVHSSAAIGFETHSGIQEKLMNLILQTVKTKKPQAQNVHITKLWSEAVDDNKVRAVYAYQYTEASENNDQVERTVEGEVFLHREPSNNNSVDKWVIQQIKNTGDSLNFSEGILVTPVAEPADEETPE